MRTSDRLKGFCANSLCECQHVREQWSTSWQQNLLKSKTFLPFSSDILKKLSDSIRNFERKIMLVAVEVV